MSSRATINILFFIFKINLVSYRNHYEEINQLILFMYPNEGFFDIWLDMTLHVFYLDHLVSHELFSLNKFNIGCHKPDSLHIHSMLLKHKIYKLKV